MTTIDPTLFADVADVLNISNPVLIEKDYYAVLLLKELRALRFDDYQLVFAGGTCLTKVHQNTHRMSEDIDIKLVASDEALGKSHSLQRQNRKGIHQSIVAMLESSPLFHLVETTASEKFVSLLRRTAACNRDTTQADDETLIRHVYDLHLIGSALTKFNSIKALVAQVIQIDVDQFGNRHEEFQENPSQELKYGLNLLITKPIYEKRYKQFIGPLVYHPTPATWDEAIKTVLRMSDEWL